MSRSIFHHRRAWSALLTLGAIIALLPATTADAATLTAQDVEAIKQAAEALQGQAGQAVAPLAPGEVKVMQAAVMSVTGRADWRPDPQSRWKRAAVDDLLDPGAEIRTGRQAKLVLRVGMNASILVDRHSRVVLPQMVQVGDTLRTAAQVTRGRADFKVDRVGLTNDFSVVTPSTTLAVRGTGFAVQCGAFNGTEVASSRFNEIFAIEITYFLSRVSYLLSGGSTTSNKHPNPAVAALFQTFGPPPIVSALIEDADTPALLETAMTGTPLYNKRRVDINLLGAMETVDDFPEDDDDDPMMMEPPMEEIPDFQDFGMVTDSFIAEFVCFNLFEIFLTYDDFMIEDFGGQGGPGSLDFPGVAQLFSDVNQFVCQGREEFTDQDLANLVQLVRFYCESSFATQPDIDRCIQNFADAGVDVFLQPSQ